jgi:hypothetical protein
MQEVLLEDDELKFIIDNFGDKMPKKLKMKFFKRRTTRGLFIVYRILNLHKSIKEWKVSTSQINSYTQENEETYSCWIKNNYYEVDKEQIFYNRWEAKLAGHKKLLDLINNHKKKDSYPDKIKYVKRQIELIEEFPEKFI